MKAAEIGLLGSIYRQASYCGLSFLLVTGAIASEEGIDNNFFGIGAGASNTSGSANAFFGGEAGNENTTGSANSYFGRFAGFNTTTGSDNSFFGYRAGLNNTEGHSNAFFGNSAGQSNTLAPENSFFGSLAGQFNTMGFQNSFFGSSAGEYNTTGSLNSFFGNAAGVLNSTGSENSFFGRGAGFYNDTGNLNTYIGRLSGTYSSIGDRNSYLGAASGWQVNDGSRNTFVGFAASGLSGLTNATAIGFQAQVSADNSLVLGSIPGLNEYEVGYSNSYTNVGIGTDVPNSALHIERTDGTALLSVVNSGQQSFLPRTSLELVNKGPVAAEFIDSSGSGGHWILHTQGAVGSSNSFFIDTVHSGPGLYIPKLQIHENGNLYISGTLSQGSSRTFKDHIVQIAAESVLTKLSGLPVYEWSYLTEVGERHIGPMAEDFFDAFGLGASAQHVAPGDIAGVALAAARALNERSEALEAENAELRDRLERVEAMLSIDPVSE